MKTLSSPTEAFVAAAQTVLGRATAFALSCSLGGLTGAGLDRVFYRIHEGHWSWQYFAYDLLISALVVPLALASLLASYGIVFYLLCLLTGWAFIRMELSFYWLLVPFALVAIDRMTIPGSHLW